MNETTATPPKQGKLLRHDRSVRISCAGCVGTCPTLALDMFQTDLQLFLDKCTSCGICVRVCPVGALSLEKR